MRKPPQYRLHKPTGQAVVTLHGKDHYLGQHESPESWHKYHRLLLEHTTRLQTPGVGRPAKATPAPNQLLGGSTPLFALQ